MPRTLAVLIAIGTPWTGALAQHPLTHPIDAVEVRYAVTQPVVTYTLRVDSADLSGYDVTIHIRNAPDTFRLALAAHPEYDDHFFRYVERLGITAPAGAAAASIVREDSALWRVAAPGGTSEIRYRLHLPAQQRPIRSSWVPFLAAGGGLVGGPHSFMYVVGATLAPSYATFELPPGWDIATGLAPTVSPNTFFAPSVDVLLDSPALVGHFRSWRFAVDGVPHRVVYWPLPDAQPFDTLALLRGLEGVAAQAIALFGRAPYRDYSFLIQDGAGGSLEHRNSVTIGATSARLATDLPDVLGEATHEYFHTWNLMRIRPAGYGEVDYRPPRRSRGLWWSEGITMLYADALLRRAGQPRPDSTRPAHLEGLITRYLASPGNSRFSPESVSVVTYATPPGALGDYGASVHLQGEIIGTMLDLVIRDATRGRRSLDDVMRVMMARYSGEQGFTTRDIEAVVHEVCGCDVRPFFDRYVRAGNPIPFDRYLALAGWRPAVTWGPGAGRDGTPLADLRVFAWLPPGDTALRLLIGNPASVWGGAGLHTGDRIARVNGAPVTTMDAFRAVFGRLKIGDTVTVEVTRPAGPYRATVVVTVQQRPTVR
ncbi:MAG TPA: PDZ domain-containing protein, partial [Gemmatimonadales bacterium]